MLKSRRSSVTWRLGETDGLCGAPTTPAHMPTHVPVIVIGYEPAGVSTLVRTLRVDVKGGKPLPDEKENVAPDGKPAAVRLTGEIDWLLPLTKEICRLKDADPPCSIVT